MNQQSSNHEALLRLKQSAERGEVSFEAAAKIAAQSMTELQKRHADETGLSHEEFMIAYLEVM